MKITRLSDIERKPRRVAIGTFDGVHLGHREVIRGSDTVLTFEPHPLSVLHPDAAPKLLTTLEMKAELIGDLGVEEVVVIPFDKEFSQRSAQRFIDEVLVEQLSATRVSVGQNFRFGNRAQGDTQMLESAGKFESNICSLVEVEGESVSSSHIRGLVLAGEVDIATRFIGRPFQMRGIVAHGDKRGRELGFPTANLVPDDQMACPGHGIYACYGNGISAAVNVGIRPTFESGRGLLVEAHLIDADEDLYDKELKIDFVRRLRGEKAFPSAEDLIEQMTLDVAKAREILA